MKPLFIFIWLAFSQAAFAQTAVVDSGDHSDFTRLVVELPAPAAWKMGRTTEGYELRIAGDALQFDLSNVFTTIARNRLASIWEDPATGGLRLGIGCACFALAFEFRPGILVVDLRDGPPPDQSTFEVALDGGQARPLRGKPTPRPREKPSSQALTGLAEAKPALAYDWLGKIPQSKGTELLSRPKVDAPALPVTSDIGPLKDALLWQLSRGAAQGIVQMTVPRLSSGTPGEPPVYGPRANVRLGEVPGFDATTSRPPADALREKGEACVRDETLDLAKWATDQDIVTQLANSRANLVGEFDRPQQDAIISATKLLIYLGFGAEARQFLTLFSVENPDRAIWYSMAKIVDGAPDATGPFSGMQTCDTAAALWAALAVPTFRASEIPRPEAVLRSFSALPAHLRRSLGPGLVEKFLAVKDISTARSIGQAVLRGGLSSAAPASAMSASIDVAAGNPQKAVDGLAPILSDAGPALAETLITLVDARLAAGLEIDPKTPAALAAILQEQAGSPLDPALRRAQILALGATGQFDEAFDLAANNPLSEPELWSILAKSGADSAVLSHAVVAAETTLPALPMAEKTQIATHLLALGLPDAALVWLGASGKDSTEESRIVAAKAYLAKGSPDQAILMLANIDNTTASDLRAQAFWQMQKPLEAANAWKLASNPDADMRAQTWAGNWAELSRNDASEFRAAAELASAQPITTSAQSAGPLALGNALVEDSQKTRTILANLLSVVPALKPD